ncbi:ornithine carbamoyltransferase [Rhodospirillum centenum]|uniref:Ornithine carbamoyltransferase n=1 Tax=Rhodospirillum centenum (strain ATCC 51521 / SW) TaxID=414684 RepID=B6IUN3_RHOCS|nr:ornithine carbamoyltransferase [Rhodospirillum centenum]ACI99858.1 ornithine carbamoyltransferase [Rhodospirillum centenum SW]
MSPASSRKVRHFIDIHLLDAGSLRGMLDYAAALKRAKQPEKPLLGRTLALIFEKPSTRTRVSFEVGMRQLGGEVITLTGKEIQLGHGETIGDTARVLSRFVDAIMLRTDAEEKLHEMAEAASVPVINGLTDKSHPVQIMADILTFEERKGPITGKVVCWSGDANNVCESWIHAAVRFDFELRVACPAELAPSAETLEWVRRNDGRVIVTRDAEAAVAGADAVVTDTWVSMHHQDAERRHALLKPYQVNERLMGLAQKDAIFMHCLPAHRDEEVSTAVIDGPQSVVWDEAENRMHAQKGILAWCLNT